MKLDPKLLAKHSKILESHKHAPETAKSAHYMQALIDSNLDMWALLRAFAVDESLPAYAREYAAQTIKDRFK